MTAADQEDDDVDDGTVVSAGSFETCAMTQIPTAHQSSGVNGGVEDSGNPEELQRRILPREPVGEGEAATLIQSAFRRFMVRSRSKDRLPTYRESLVLMLCLQARRRLLQEVLRRSSEQEGRYAELEPKSPASASMAASVEVQIGESLSNLRLSDDGGSSPTPSAQHRASQKLRPQVFRAKVPSRVCCLLQNMTVTLIKSSVVIDGCRRSGTTARSARTCCR